MVLLAVSSNTFIFYKKSMRMFGIWSLDGVTPRTVIVNCAILLIEIAGRITHESAIVGSCIASQTGSPAIMSLLWIAFPVTIRLAARLLGGRLAPLIKATIADWSFTADATERRIMRSHDAYGTFPLFLLVAWELIDLVIRDVISFANASAPNDGQDCEDGYGRAASVAAKILTFAVYVIEIFTYYSTVILLWSLVMHLCGQYVILRRRFEKLLWIEKRSMRRARLRQLVDRHNRLLDLSGRLGGSVNVFVSIDIFAQQFLIGVFAFELGYAIKRGDFMIIVEGIEFTTIAATLVFFHCHMSEYLMECAEGIGDALIRCSWNDLSKESIVNFSIVIARSRKPPSLSAAKLYRLDHGTFKHVLHSIYSYVSLIVTATSD